MNNCKNCGKKCNSLYCSNLCQQEYQRSLKINEWLKGKNSFRKGGTSIFPWMKEYLIENAGKKCSNCGWDEINPFTGKSPLEIDHIDGDAYNNLKENLRVLCPNCHSLTKTYKNIGNRTSSRTYRNKPL